MTLNLDLPGAPTRLPDDPEGSRPITIVDPKDGSLVGTVQSADEADVAAAVQAAVSAAEGWAATAPAERGALLQAMADGLAARADEVAALNTRETGKPAGDARGGVDAAVGTLRQYAELGPLHRSHSLRGADVAIDYARPEPRGVVAAITPWNDPVAVAAGLVGAALVTGNTVVHKPSERCPHVGALLGEIWSAPLPDGVLTTLTGDGRTGETLCAPPGCTSSPTSARRRPGGPSSRRPSGPARTSSWRTAGTTPSSSTPTSIPPGRPARPRWGRTRTAARSAPPSSASTCTPTSRTPSSRPSWPRRTSATPTAWPPWSTPGCGPRCTGRWRRRPRPAPRVLTGGEIPEGAGAHYPATVVVDVPSDADLMRGGDLRARRAGPGGVHFAEGLNRAVASRYGLAATVLTGSLEHATEAVRRLPVGTVKVNAVFGGAPGGARRAARRQRAGLRLRP